MRLYVPVPWPLYLLAFPFILSFYVLLGIGWGMYWLCVGTYRFCGLLRLALASLFLELAKDCDRMQERQDRRRARR